MAGIGFELKKILRKRTWSSYSLFLVYGTALVGGPWIITVLTLILISTFIQPFLAGEEILLFFVTLTYSFAFSLILSGPIQFILHRYVADQFFSKRKEKIFSGVLTSLIFILFLSLCFSLLFYSPLSAGNKITSLYKSMAILLFLALNSIWVLIGLLTAIRRYKPLLSSFLLGSFLCLFASFLLAKRTGFLGALAGYTLGIILISLLILFFIRREFSFSKWRLNREFPSYFRTFPSLIFIGLFYICGVWIDKIIIWYTLGERIPGFSFRYFLPYDLPIYLAYLTMIPVLFYFTIGIEPDLLKTYQNLLTSIEKKPLILIEQKKEEVKSLFRSGLRDAVHFQLIITLLFLILSELISKFLKWPVSIKTFRILLGAAFFQALTFFTINFLLYFDLRKDVLKIVSFFLFSNAFFTILTLNLKGQLGCGYLLSIFLSFLFSLYCILSRLQHIEYYIFTTSFRKEMKE